MPVEPYLYFNGRCEEAIEFYKDAIGAELAMLMRFSENPDPMPPGTLPAGMEHKVMHACLKIGDASVMASDGMCTSSEPQQFEGFSLSLSARDAAEARRWFEALADGGEIRMPLDKTFFAEQFGMVADRFGVPWMVIVPADIKA